MAYLPHPFMDLEFPYLQKEENLLLSSSVSILKVLEVGVCISLQLLRLQAALMPKQQAAGPYRQMLAILMSGTIRN